jgi:N-acetylglucosaminyldiphosphoundecaprenol N-acetyl-beta-D-mannosaminyltransferase
MRSEVLGLPVDILSRQETVEKIDGWLRVPAKKPRMVVTAYSEFFVAAKGDKVFFDIIKKADLVTPDGISVLAAVKYLKRTQGIKKSKGLGVTKIGRCLVEGLKAGGEILSGQAGESVTGVWLFSELTKMAEKRGWKIFLLGGWGDVSPRTARMLLERFPKLRVTYDVGETKVGTDKRVDEQVVKKINAFKPDIVFVQYNPVKQEKWIASHLPVLKAGVVMGVGGTFNEYLGDFKKAPLWMERMGLKWLWRMIVEPKRVGRIFKAIVVFPWLVFRSSLTR